MRTQVSRGRGDLASIFGNGLLWVPGGTHSCSTAPVLLILLATIEPAEQGQTRTWLAAISMANHWSSSGAPPAWASQPRGLSCGKAREWLSWDANGPTSVRPKKSLGIQHALWQPTLSSRRPPCERSGWRSGSLEVSTAFTMWPVAAEG